MTRPWVASIYCTVLLLGSCTRRPESNQEKTMSEQSWNLVQDSLQERTIQGGDRHTWHWPVRGGTVGRLQVTEVGVDVVVHLYAANDPQPELVVDGLDGEWGVERMSVVPKTDTTYRIEIEPLSPRAHHGRYRLVTTPLAAATQQDRINAKAERLFDAAERLRRQATPESRRAALDQYREAKELFAKGGNSRWQLEVLQRMGFLHKQLGERRQARTFYRQLLDQARRVQDRKEEGVTLNRLGQLDFVEEQVASAQQRFEAAMAIAREIGDEPLRAISLNNLAMLRYRREELVGAIRDLTTVSQLWRDLQRPLDAANALFNLNFALRAQGKYPEAFDALDEALQLRRLRNDRAGIAEVLLQVGNIHRLQGELAAAAEAFEQALDGGAEVLTGNFQVLLNNNLGLVRLQQGRQGAAIEHLEEARVRAHQLELRRPEAMACLNLAALRRTQGDSEASLLLLARSREIFDELADQRHLAACSLIEGLNLRDQGHAEEALRLLEAAVDRVEELRLRQSGWALRMAFFATRQNYYDELTDLLYELYRESGEARYAERALYTSERRRARSLLDAIAEGGLAFRGDTALLDLERRQSEELAEVSRQRQLTTTEAPELARRERKLLVQLETTRAAIHRSSPQYAQLTRSRPLDVETIQREVLDGQTRLLAYALGEQRSLLFVLDHEGPLRLFELPERRLIERAVAKARLALTTLSPARQAANRRSLQELSNLILGPLATQLGNKRLAIVADGALQTIPFAALPEPISLDAEFPLSDKPQPWLLEGREVVRLPSASTLAALRSEVRGRAPAPFEIAVFADPVFSTDDPRVPSTAGGGSATLPVLELTGVRRNQSLGEALHRLPATALEAQAIRDLVGHPDTSLFATSFEANRAHFNNEELGQFRTLHFATHGFLDPVNPELSGLALSMVDEQGRPTDGFIRAYELYSRRLGAELVVLSACQTGLGKLVAGEGLVGLPRGFLYAGVPRVIVSLWNVADESTAVLMDHFYREYGDGVAPVAALRRAQLAMLAEKDKPDSLPFHWAPFIFLGDWLPVNSLESRSDQEFGTGDDGTVTGSDLGKGDGYSATGDSSRESDGKAE